jgi:hypothetical protein
LALPPIRRAKDTERWNALAAQRLQRIGELGRRWREAVGSDIEGRLLSAVETTKVPTVRPFVFANTLRYLFYSAVSAFGIGAASVLESARYSAGRYGLLWVLIVAGAVGLLFSLPMLVKTLRVALRHAPISGTLRQIALALRDAMCEADLIQTRRASLRISTQEIEPGLWATSLKGGTFYEESFYADCLAELLGPIENPRYLITRPGHGWFRRRVDYHSLPTPLGANKERANVFAAHWRRRVGTVELIYTRTRGGRATLLRARGRSLSSAFVDRSRRRDRWQ